MSFMAEWTSLNLLFEQFSPAPSFILESKLGSFSPSSIISLWNLFKCRPTLEYILLTLLGGLIAAIIKYPNRAIGTRDRPDLKGLVGYPLIGNLPQTIRAGDNNLQQLHELFEEMGDVITMTVPFMGRFIIINNPELMEHILKTNFDNYVKGSVFRSQLQDILGCGIFVADGDVWRFHRKTAANVFTAKFYRSLVQRTFRQSAHGLCRLFEEQYCGRNPSDIHDGSCDTQRMAQEPQPVDLQAAFLNLTLDAFGKLMFGADFNALCSDTTSETLGSPFSNEFGQAFDYLMQEADKRSTKNPFWFITDKIFFWRWIRQREAIRVLDTSAARAFDRRRMETEEEKNQRPRDLLDHFVEFRDEDGCALTDSMLRDVFVNFMMAGRDTTAQGLTWQFHYLLTHESVMNRLLEEIDIVLGKDEDQVTYETLMNEMPYLKAVFYETLRLSPPIAKNSKMVLEDDILPDGTKVHKGDFIGYSNWCLGRNRQVWGENASQFDPERWLTPDPAPPTLWVQEAASKKTKKSPFGRFRSQSAFKFASFNAGPRTCLGQTFATLEVMVTTVVLLQRFDFRLGPGYSSTPAIRGSVTLPMKYPLWVLVTRKSGREGGEKEGEQENESSSRSPPLPRWVQAEAKEI
ncbi:hypothetical protein BGW38_000714 [Lunasporangiospora selenospora]|uniref:Cytochrome P450 n=1 Tax=Lunasporangiospora selenospora TaxID=979761 RepID=A0A9P6KES2_9FUNG|nr:hypothetical protein BGW38_000714 [Lunasporangiospora selenospora]